VRKFIKREGFEKDLNIIFVDEAYIQDLNKRFLSRDYATDVLSFNLDDIGEIYVLREREASIEDLWELVLHGLLHLSGYNHNTPDEQARMDEMSRRYR